MGCTLEVPAFLRMAFRREGPPAITASTLFGERRVRRPESQAVLDRFWASAIPVIDGFTGKQTLVLPPTNIREPIILGQDGLWYELTADEYLQQYEPQIIARREGTRNILEGQRFG